MRVMVHAGHATEGRDGPHLGPFEWAQLTYGTLVVQDDGTPLAVFVDGLWTFTEAAGEHVGVTATDLTIAPCR